MKNNTEFDELIPFVEAVITKASSNEKISINDNIEISDFDYDRTYLNVNNQEWTIRMWNYLRNGKVQWTLFKDIPEKDGSYSGKEVCKGSTLIDIIY